MSRFLVLIAFLAINLLVNAVPYLGARGNLTVDPDAVDSQKGAMETMTGYGKTPWPGSRITYCYASVEARQTHRKYVEAGIQVWMKAFGGEASATTRHGVVFDEVRDVNGQPMYCYFNNYKNYEEPGDWHFAIDGGTLAVHSEKAELGAGARANIGYAPDGPKGRHRLITGLDSGTETEESNAATIAHELGHVLGLYHEHQRSDRDQHIEFRCNEVVGYNSAMLRAFVTYPSISVADAANRLCTDWHFGNEFGFAGTSFYKDMRHQRYFGPYDVTSIMHYGSVAFCNPACYTDPSKCPMSVGGQYILKIMEPSEQDLEAVRLLYPWKG